MRMKTFENLVNIPLLVRKLDTDTKVVRARPHSDINDLFKFKKELSYPPADKALLMRANLDKEPVFYGAIFSEDPKGKDLPRLTCIFETCNHVKDDMFSGKTDFTFSLWINKKPINLFVIPVFDSYDNPPADFLWYFDMWKKLISEYNLNEDVIRELEELSRKFSLVTDDKKEMDECYTFTATFTKTLFEAHPQIDGIMYPSAQLSRDGMGINVAIRPSVIDSDFELKRCSICRYFKHSKAHQFVLTYKDARINQNGKISYTINRTFHRDIDYIDKVNPAIKIKNLGFKSK